MTVQFRPATRQAVSLLISIAGPSGSGKTFSALRLARGLARGDDSKIAAIDTEAGRMLHYAAGPGKPVSETTFAFHHADLKPPFSPEAYLEAIVAADEAEYRVIVVDSFSHEWEGEGGLHDLHAAELAKEVAKAEDRHRRFGGRGEFDQAFWEDKLNIGAWKEPKTRHKRLVNRMLQSRAHIIVCLRAEEKLIIEKRKDDRGREKTVYVQTKDLPEADRWIPIVEKRWHYEPVLSLLLSPRSPGVPIPLKLQEQHRPAIPLDRPLAPMTGELLDRWSRGEDLVVAQPTEPAPAPAPQRSKFEDAMWEAAKGGSVMLNEKVAAVYARGSDRQQEWIERNRLALEESAGEADARMKPKPSLADELQDDIPF